MILGRFVKQPAETLDYDIDFSQFFADGDTILSVASPVISPSGLNAGGTFVIAGTTVKQWLTGGTDGNRYKITITVTSNAGRVKQVEFFVRVKDE